MTKLLPCPFCGGNAEIVREHGGFVAKCRHGAGAIHCGCLVHPRTLPMTTKAAAAKVWNERPRAPLYPVIKPWDEIEGVPLHDYPR